MEVRECGSPKSRARSWSPSGRGADLPNRLGPSSPSQTSSCLKIVTVSRRKRFVRIFNESQEETADLGGFTLQQLSCHSPVRMYRFPPHTLLAPRHHITVRPRSPQALASPPLTRPLTLARRCPQIWGEGPDSSKKQPPSSLAQEPIYFHSNRGCVTLLLSPKGEVSAGPDRGLWGRYRGVG